MIINLNLEGKKIIVVGGGNEAEKRIKSLLNEKCEIIVISDSINTQISKLVKLKRIKFKKQKIENIKFISELNPDLIITTTNDTKINQKIINYAKKRIQWHIVQIILKIVISQIQQLLILKK
ncbi:MAG: putative Precorrin-2 dehydrogenase [Nitrosopumilus sp.]|nr:putative Precorrin-2 dehydrogenase [Candidatus Nitrosopumilus limneticus]